MSERRPIAERFEEKVRRFSVGGACWEWAGAVNNMGYGTIREGGHAGRMLLAHRVAWELVHGPVPDGLIVRHRCDNPSCVSPFHLELGTHADNQCDKAARQRGTRSKTGLPYGVVRNGRGWKAQVKSAGRKHYLGTYPTIAEAAEAAEHERVRLYGCLPEKVKDA